MNEDRTYNPTVFRNRDPTDTRWGACRDHIVNLLRSITINRNGRDISVFEIIKTILGMEHVSKVFIEGSMVKYVYDKLCLGISEDKLVRPGDIDLHIDFEGSWSNFINPALERIQNEYKRISDEEAIIKTEKKAMMRTSMSFNDVQDMFEHKLREIEEQRQSIPSPESVISELLSLRTFPVDYGFKNNIIEKVDMGAAASFNLINQGDIPWKPNPELELTLTDLKNKKEFGHTFREGFIVTDIPKLVLSMEGQNLKYMPVSEVEPMMSVEGVNLDKNYTNIIFTDVDNIRYDCSGFVKAYELYLRYRSATDIRNSPDNPLVKFKDLDCLNGIESSISNFNEPKILTTDECNDFICRFIMLISSKHQSDVVIIMFTKLKNAISTVYNVDEKNIELYLMMCSAVCIPAGLSQRINWDGTHAEIQRAKDHATRDASFILGQLFELGPLQQRVFATIIMKNIKPSERKKPDGRGSGDMKKRQTHRKKRRNTRKKRRKTRNKRRKTRNNKRKKGKSMHRVKRTKHK